MAPISKELFTLAIPPLKSHPGGTIICSEPSPKVYLLTINSPPDNRLTVPFITTLLTALDVIEARHPSGVVVTTSSITKFYSNGLDLELALSTPGFMEDHLFPLFRRFLTYPMPTVALLNGHAFAGGFMLAMHHDYRVFSGSKGYMCVNEVEFGAPLLPPMVGIFRVKTRPDVYRNTVLEARRWTAQTGLEAGLIDSTEGWEGVEKLIKERGLVSKGETGVYGLLKTELYRDQVTWLEARGEDSGNLYRLTSAEEARKKAVHERVDKAKL